MTRSQLINQLAEKFPYLDRGELTRVVMRIFEEISVVMENGDRVELRGFGTFGVTYREARASRNPRTGDGVEVGDRYYPKFKAGRDLVRRLNRGF